MANVDITIRMLDETRQGTRGAKASFTEINQAIELMRKGLEAAKKVYDFSKEGAEIRRLGDASAEVFRQLDGDVNDAVASIREGALGAISEVDAMKAASRAAMLNVSSDADELGQLMQIAAFRGRAMGVDTTAAFNDIVTGIGRASPLILDNLGIITKGWAEEAKAAGVAYDAQFILNKVLEQGGEQLAMAGGLAEDAATSYEQLEAQTSDYVNTLKKAASQALEPTVKWLAEQVEAQNEVNYKLEEYQRITGKVVTLEQYRNRQVQENVDATVDAYHEELETLRDLDRGYEDRRDALVRTTQATADIVDVTKEMTDANRDYLDEIGRISDEHKTYTDNINDVNAERAEIEGKMQADLAAGWWEGSDRIQGYKEKLQELEDKDNELTESFEDNSDRRVLALLEEQLSADDLTEAETRWLEEIGIAKGIYSQEAVDQWRAERDEVELLIESIGRIPTEWTTNLRINTIGSVPKFAGSELDFRIANDQGMAAGGPVMAGQSYVVGELGPEIFTPKQSGNITPNNQIGGGGIDEARLGRVIVAAMQKAMQ